MYPKRIRMNPTQDKLPNPVIDGERYRRTHKASVIGILGDAAPPVFSKGSRFYNQDRWTLRTLVSVMCKWAKDNPDKWQDMVRKSKIFHREDIVEREKRYRKTLQGKYKSLRNSAKQRNYKLELSFKQFCEVIDNPCVYCGETEERIGVDRIDNSVGYTLENSAPCCKICNFMKMSMSVDEFLNHIKKIYLHK